MHARALWAAVLVASAGCLAGSDDTTSPAPPTPPGPDVPPLPDGPLEAPVPQWLTGEWWSWHVVRANRGEYDVTTAVASSAGEYRVGATELEAGIRSVLFHAPPMGVVSRSDLTWEAHGRPVDVFDWPLRDGKTWSRADAEGRQISFVAKQVDVAGGAGLEPAFQVTGAFEDGSPYVDYTYSPRVATFLTYIRHFGGGPSITATLTGHGFDRPGAVLVMTATDAYVGGSAGVMPGAVPPPTPEPPQTFTVAEGATHLVIAAFLGGGPGVYRIAFGPPAGQPIVFEHQNAPGADASVVQTRTMEPVPGQWSVAMVAGGAPGFTFAEVMGITVTEESPVG